MFQGTWHFIQDGKKTDKLAIFDKDRFSVQERRTVGKETTIEIKADDKSSIQIYQIALSCFRDS